MKTCKIRIWALVLLIMLSLTGCGNKTVDIKHLDLEKIKVSENNDIREEVLDYGDFSFKTLAKAYKQNSDISILSSEMICNTYTTLKKQDLSDSEEQLADDIFHAAVDYTLYWVNGNKVKTINEFEDNMKKIYMEVYK